MTTGSNEARARAEANFRKEERGKDGAKAMMDYQANARMVRVKTLAGDRVTVEVSPYDLEKGRLIFRHKDERAGSLSRPPQRHQFRRR